MNNKPMIQRVYRRVLLAFIAEQDRQQRRALYRALIVLLKSDPSADAFLAGRA